MKHAFLMLVAIGGLAAATACGDDDPPSGTTTTTTGGSTTGGGGAPCFEAGGGYGGFGEVCMAQAGDDDCVSCTRSSCCAELEACVPDEQCSCLLECFLSGCNPIICLQTCGQNEQVNALTQCATSCDACLE